MAKKLNVGDKIYIPVSNFGTGAVWLEEWEVVAIDKNSINIKPVAALKKYGNALKRISLKPVKPIRGDKRMRDYLSRPLTEIMNEFNKQGEWLSAQIIKNSIGDISGGKK
jgi:hypothetical protein